MAQTTHEDQWYDYLRTDNVSDKIQEIINLSKELDDKISDNVDLQCYLEQLIGSNNELQDLLKECHRLLLRDVSDDRTIVILKDLRKYITLLNSENDSNNNSNETYPEFVKKHYKS